MENTEQKVEEQEFDLTAERNERCIPLARKVLKLVGEYEGLLGDSPVEDFNKSYDELAKSILQAYLDADLPISDAMYIQQLALQPIDFAFGIVSRSINHNLEKLQVKTFGKKVEDITSEELNRLLSV